MVQAVSFADGSCEPSTQKMTSPRAFNARYRNRGPAAIFPLHRLPFQIPLRQSTVYTVRSLWNVTLSVVQTKNTSNSRAAIATHLNLNRLLLFIRADSRII